MLKTSTDKLSGPVISKEILIWSIFCYNDSIRTFMLARFLAINGIKFMVVLSFSEICCQQNKSMIKYLIFFCGRLFLSVFLQIQKLFEFDSLKSAHMKNASVLLHSQIQQKLVALPQPE